jgi:hypothetical protein
MIDVTNLKSQAFITMLIESIAHVAPEKANELEQLIQSNNILIEIDTTPVEVGFHVSPEKSTITFGLHSLELLWVRAFAYCSLYEFLTSMVLAGKDIRDVDLTVPEIKPPMDLLSWAISMELKIRDGVVDKKEWPLGLPRPFQGKSRKSLESAADELFLVAFASILHHEIGHIACGHTPNTLEYGPDRKLTPSSRETCLRWEKEADAWSASWLLGGLECTDNRFLKRALGLSLALVWIATRNIHTGIWDDKSHPPAWDRIYHNIKQHIPDRPDHPVWTFIGYVLTLHLISQNSLPLIQEVETPEDWVNKLLDHLSRLHIK